MSTLPALQQTLAAEHAAVYVYGVLGGRAADLTDLKLRGALAAAYDDHVTRRDELRQMISALAADPVASAAAYSLPRDLTTSGQIAAQALRTEQACVDQYGALVAATSPDSTRTWAVSALSSGALRELDFGGRAQALPGLTAPTPETPSASASASASSSATPRG